MPAIRSSYFSALNAIVKRTPYQLMVGLLLLVTLLLVVGCQSEPNDFLAALRDGNDSAAFALLNSELQKELGGKDGFAEWADIWRPSSWSFRAKCSADLNVALAMADGQLESGERFSINIHQSNLDGTWLIQGIEVTSSQIEIWGLSSGLDCMD